MALKTHAQSPDLAPDSSSSFEPQIVAWDFKIGLQIEDRALKYPATLCIKLDSSFTSGRGSSSGLLSKLANCACHRLNEYACSFAEDLFGSEWGIRDQPCTNCDFIQFEWMFEATFNKHGMQNILKTFFSNGSVVPINSHLNESDQCWLKVVRIKYTYNTGSLVRIAGWVYLAEVGVNGILPGPSSKIAAFKFFYRKPWLEPKPSQAKPSLRALALASKFKSQSPMKPGQRLAKTMAYKPSQAKGITSSVSGLYKLKRRPFYEQTTTVSGSRFYVWPHLRVPPRPTAPGARRIPTNADASLIARNQVSGITVAKSTLSSDIAGTARIYSRARESK
ncbi:hypothetical protein FB451DRAFT_1184821 [Mycena latifolia]|nr:hypothetical protein FB451DRAFT_1184821 [Mycena latifolia]